MPYTKKLKTKNPEQKSRHQWYTVLLSPLLQSHWMIKALSKPKKNKYQNCFVKLISFKAERKKNFIL